MRIDAKKAERVAFLLKNTYKSDLTNKQIDDIIGVLEVLYHFHAVGDGLLWIAIKSLLEDYREEKETRNEN